MIRRIITIDSEKCNGCGLCVSACHEGAIGLEDGKAKLLRDDYCDGLGDCLPVCPMGAISFETREADEYNEAEVKKNMENKNTETLACGCAGTHVKTIEHEDCGCAGTEGKHEAGESCGCADGQNAHAAIHSQLKQWPIQMKLVPTNADYFDNAHLLVASDCTAYAYGNFHNDYMRNRITLIGCPKLDDIDYSEKLTAIIKQNSIKSVTVVRMEVPCCAGMERAVITALKNSGKMIPWQVVTISTNGRVLED